MSTVTNQGVCAVLPSNSHFKFWRHRSRSGDPGGTLTLKTLVALILTAFIVKYAGSSRVTMSWEGFKSCALQSTHDSKRIMLEDGVEVEIGGVSEPQVRVKPDFSCGLLDVTQLNTHETRFPERGNLIMKTPNDRCRLKNSERMILSRNIAYRVDFPPIKKSLLGERAERDVGDEPPAKGLRLLGVRKEENDGKMGGAEAEFLDGSWTDNEDLKVLYFVPKHESRSTKCACFDMDQTIINTKSGKKFPENHQDWVIMYNASIPKKLHELHRNKYRIVVFSNQRGLATGKESKSNLKLKFTSVMKRIGVPMMMFLSYGSGIYRKPCIGLWNLLEEENGPIEKEESFYVGDAAGRPKNWQPGAPKDHSKVDRLFALNLGIKFHTPEEFFLKSSKNKFEMPVFDAKKLRDNRIWGIVHEPEADRKELRTLEDLIGLEPELLVFVGYPASGKSTLACLLSAKKSYVHINQDTLGSLEKCVKMAKEALANNQSVMIDNTNFLEEQRKRFIELSRAAGVDARCFWLDCTLENARHNNKFRLLTSPDAKHKDITDVVLYSLRKRFQEPRLGEGFKQIVKIRMVPSFDSPHREDLYYTYLLEN